MDQEPSKSVAFGDESHHYTRPTGLARSQRRFSPEEEQLWRLLDEFEPGLQDRVARAVRQWNTILRDYLRAETGLRLSIGAEHQAVPIRIVDGLPLPLREALFDLALPELMPLFLRTPLLQQTSTGLSFLEKHFDAAIGFAGDPGSPTAEEVRRTRGLVEVLVERLGKHVLFKRLQGIHQDVLGAYFFRAPEVQLYWMAIGLVSRLLRVPSEMLTVVVLAHELTHAYTHVGRDIDGNRWATGQMAGTDLDIVSGLAQFYTEVLCKKRLSARLPGAGKAFDKLLELQSGPYLVHEGWSEGGNPAGEAVRFALIGTRLQGTQDYGTFFGALQKARTDVGLDPLGSSAA